MKRNHPLSEDSSLQPRKPQQIPSDPAQTSPQTPIVRRAFTPETSIQASLLSDVQDPAVFNPSNPAASQTPGRAPVPPKSKKKKKLHWYDWIILLVILILLSFAAYSYFHGLWVKHNQKQLSSELFNLAPVSSQISTQSMQGIYVDPEANKVEGEGWESFAKGSTNYNPGEKVLIRPIGRLIIDSIDLSLPILDKADLISLRYGIGLYQQSAPLYGEKGISVLFGHHMLERGHYFNRLNEVKVGDPVRLLGNGEEWIYTVDKTRIVAPEELVSLLKQNSNEKYLLMITCENQPAFDKRLLVYAKLTSRSPLQK